MMLICLKHLLMLVLQRNLFRISRNLYRLIIRQLRQVHAIFYIQMQVLDKLLRILRIIHSILAQLFHRQLYMFPCQCKHLVERRNLHFPISLILSFLLCCQHLVVHHELQQNLVLLDNHIRFEFLLLLQKVQKFLLLRHLLLLLQLLHRFRLLHLILAIHMLHNVWQHLL